MRVLFASGIDGFCHRYATLHWAEQLATQGVASTVRAHTDPRLVADLDAHDVLVLFRAPDGAFIRHLLAHARARGRATVFAVDDLIVDPSLPLPAAVRDAPADERRLWLDGVARYRRALEQCDAFLATTAPLGALGATLGKPTYVHHCGLAARELRIGAAARAAAARHEGVRLGYFSGTATHDEDLRTIAPLLRALLERHPALGLTIVGPVALDPALAPYAPRVERLPLVSWPVLAERIAAVDVNLAPLAWHDPFVAAKGAVKYLEAAAVGAPTVASPTAAFRNAIRDGTNGLLAGDAGWDAALSSVITDPGRCARLGAAARADVETRFAPAAQGAALRAFLADVLARVAPARRAATALPGADDEVALARRFPGEVARAAREPAGLPDLAAAATDVSPALGDGVVLAQRFHATRPGLARVDVHTVTYGLTLDHVLELRLRRDDGSVVGGTTLPAALAPDRDWVSLEVAPEASSDGRHYVLELCANGTGDRNALAFGVTSAAGGEGYRLGDAHGTAALALRTFAADAAAEVHAARHA
ncbi:MAG TPA: glycosyltransferase [Candidatus Binatia bacterium]|jgi:glycosyltransferase involved in cell wall biosynthesis